MYAQKGRWVTTAGLVLCLCEAVSAAEVVPVSNIVKAFLGPAVS